MPRKVTTARPARAKAGHRLYFIGAKSDCPVHSYCAYDGTEPDQCAICHVSLDVDCEHRTGGMPSGKRAAGCGDCKEVFSSNTAFDKHRRQFSCIAPDTVGLTLVQRGDYMVWALPGEPPER